jgi:hypothetical protein
VASSTFLDTLSGIPLVGNFFKSISDTKNLATDEKTKYDKLSQYDKDRWKADPHMQGQETKKFLNQFMKNIGAGATDAQNIYSQIAYNRALGRQAQLSDAANAAQAQGNNSQALAMLPFLQGGNAAAANPAYLRMLPFFV